MTLRLKQDTKTQKRTRGEELNTKGKTPYLEGTLTLEEDKLCFMKRTNLDLKGPKLLKR
jgi:hypothetical protein